jgi:hypothetical protein
MNKHAMAKSTALSVISVGCIAVSAWVAGAGTCDVCARGASGSDQRREFPRDSGDLRRELMNRRFELQRENLQALPDRRKMSSLRAEIDALRSRIATDRSRCGMNGTLHGDGECRPGPAGCGSCAGGRDCGRAASSGSNR